MFLGLVLGRRPHWNQVREMPTNKSRNKSQGSLKRRYGSGCCRSQSLRPLCSAGFSNNSEGDLIFIASGEIMALQCTNEKGAV